MKMWIRASGRCFRSCASEQPVLKDAGEEAETFPDYKRELHETCLVFCPAIVGCVDLYDALGRYEDEAIGEGG